MRKQVRDRSNNNKKDQKPLVLNRETVRELDDQALHQIQGGGKMASSYVL